MINSMTGFARCELQSSHGPLTCELRSVNHRYLEASFKLPEELRPLEPELRRQLAATLRRGKVDCMIHWRQSSQAERELLLDEAALERLLASSRSIAAQITDKTAAGAHINIIEVLRWPGVLRETVADVEGLHADGRQVFATALQQLADARAREGARLHEMVSQRCAALAEQVTQARERMPDLRQKLRDRLQTKLAELGANVDAERFEQEVVMLLQRADVDEELDRIDSHLKEIEQTLSGRESAGRRLDFLMQELNREANTFSSKSQEIDTTRLAVEMKVLIEQMREQVQNIE
jgi:uncharacterized protein (TIGR00255 family)